MAYQINFTDSVNKGFIQVDSNTVNTDTSLTFPGRSKSDYGSIILENLLHLLENFANNNPPANPVEGQLWYDTTTGVDQLKIYDGIQWVSASSIKKANSRPEPVESNLGDLWVDTVNQQLFLYNGGDWTLIGPDFSQGSSTGSKFETIVDTTNVSRSVIVNYVNGVAILIISQDEFKPKLLIQGFDTIKPGLNISNTVKYYGTSEKSENLIVPGEGAVPAVNFARRDQDNTFARPLRVQNNGGITIGETPLLSLSVSASNAVFRNLASNGDIQFRLTDSNSSVTVLTVKSNKRVGINKNNPTEAVDVEGNIKTSGSVFVGDQLQAVGAVDFSGTLTVAGDTVLGNTILKNILPDQDGRNIGSAVLRFDNVFAQSFNANTFTGQTFNGTFVGTLDGAATRLTANTAFELSGDVTSGQVVFGGENNVGGTRTFNTTLSSTFITNKPLTSSVNLNDEILIVRSGTLQKITQQTLVSTVPIIPVGMIVPYGGDIAPSGWLLCDGSVLPTTAPYNILHSAIGWRFDPILTNTFQFRLPDLRGRFALGSSSMTNLDNLGNPLDPNLSLPDSTAVDDPEAGQIGAKAGEANRTIETENLPDHIHTLNGDQGTAFYAITNLLNAPDTNAISLDPPIGGTSVGSFINQTGSVVSANIGEDFSVVNPYQTVNYIIYAGISGQ
jgi:microcystin-dependent protein